MVLELYEENFYYYLSNMRLVDFSAFTGNVKVGSVNQLNTQDGWLLLFQLTILSRTVITV